MGKIFNGPVSFLGFCRNIGGPGRCSSRWWSRQPADQKSPARGQAVHGQSGKNSWLSPNPSNEHEAALAMQKANELIEKHHIEELGNDAEYRYGFGIIDRKKKRIESYQRRICTILHDFFLVRVVLASLYDPLRNETYKTIELLGTKENVVIAEYCYFFLENRLASLWSLHKHRFKGSTRTEKNSYYLGLLRGFYQKLQEQKKRKKDFTIEPQLGDLVVADEKRLENFVGMRFPHLRKAARSGAKVYRTPTTKG